jgi:hypothetical protein
MGSENRAGDPWALPQEPTLADLLRAWARDIELGIRTHVPATVVSYAAATNTALVQVGALPVQRVADPTKIPATTVSLKGVPPNAEATLQPIQLKVPVAQLRTNTARFTLPLTTGDQGMLHVCDRSLEAWMLAGVPSDPQLAFTHALKDSVFVPGLFATTSPAVPPIDAVAVNIDGTAIKIGNALTSVEHVVKAESLMLALIAAVTATTVTPTDGGASFKATLLAQLALILPAQIASVKVTVE